VRAIRCSTSFTAYTALTQDMITIQHFSCGNVAVK